MDKWRSKGKSGLTREDSLLPPTRRVACITPPPLLDKERSKKWYILNGLFKRVSSYLDAQSSSSSLEDVSERPKRKTKNKSRKRSSGYGNSSSCSSSSSRRRSEQPPDYQRNPAYRLSREDLANANAEGSLLMATTLLKPQQLSQHRLEVGDGQQSSSHQSRSSDGSVEGRRLRKDKLKARAEAKRNQLCAADSSIDESSNDELHLTSGSLRQQQQQQQLRCADANAGKRRSRSSRTERYLKRMCNGASNGNTLVPGLGKPAALAPDGLLQADTRNLEARGGSRNEEFRPVDRAPRSSDYLQNNTTSVGSNGNAYRFESDVANDNYYTRQAEIGVNPLVQQTLQYFSEFDRSMAAQHKARKTYPGPGQPHHRRSKTNPQPLSPPKPPSRDHRSRVLDDPNSLDKYHQMLRYVSRPPPPPPPPEAYPENNGYASRCMLQSPNTEVRSINEGHYLASPNSSLHKAPVSLSPPRSPLLETFKTTAIRSNVESSRSSPLEANSCKYATEPSSVYFSAICEEETGKAKDRPAARPRKLEVERRSSHNLEEALNELEAIYNSLQLGDDEELLDRAEKRSMEEFHYRGITASPDDSTGCAIDLAARRKTWADSMLGPETPDRLRDDMAYRRMHPKERPSSIDGQSSLSSISYLMTSPYPPRRQISYIDPKRKPRRKEPDVTLDDVVFRSLQYANNTLKVVEPQPPFGIPLGPITTAAESDYLHTNPLSSPRSRSPYIPSCEPDLVTDDLAFRNLRKDAQPQTSSRQPSPCFLSPSSPTSPPLSQPQRQKRAVRSLSANLYGLINRLPGARAPDSLFDSEDQASEVNEPYGFEERASAKSSGAVGRRTSDPELLGTGWHRIAAGNAHGDDNRAGQSRRQKDASSDVSSSRSYDDESSDERNRVQWRSLLADRDADYKTGSERGSSYLSSSCSTPPPTVSSAPSVNREAPEPITEQEISVYKKLCQDLENLVQLTKGIDAPSSSSNAGSRQRQPEPAVAAAAPPLEKPSGHEKSSSAPEEPSPTRQRYHVEEMSVTEAPARNSNAGTTLITICGVDEPPTKREITSILHSLRSFGEDLDEGEDEEEEEDEEEAAATRSCCSDAGEAPVRKVTKEGGARDEQQLVQRPARDRPGACREKAKAEPKREQSQQEEEGDVLEDNMYFRNFQLAKLSAEWKEGAAKECANVAAVAPGAESRRRTSLNEANNAATAAAAAAATAAQHWQGMNKCNHKYNSMPAKTSSLLPFRLYGSKRKSNNRKSICTIS